MSAELLIILIIIPVAILLSSIVFQIRFMKISLLKFLFTFVLTGFQNLFFFLELDKIKCITKISRNTFINITTFPTTV